MIFRLPAIARVGLGQADRLDDLLELPLDLAVRVLDEVLVEQALADELLGDRRGAAAAAAEAVEAGRDDRQRVEARVLPERLVLDRGLGVDDDRRDVLEGDDLAARLAEPGQLDLARPVVDDRLLLERELVEVVGSVRPVVRPANADTVVTATSSAMPANRNQMTRAMVPAARRAGPLPVRGAARVRVGGFVQGVTPDPRASRGKDAIPRRFGCAAEPGRGYGARDKSARCAARRRESSGGGEPRAGGRRSPRAARRATAARPPSSGRAGWRAAPGGRSLRSPLRAAAIASSS